MHSRHSCHKTIGGNVALYCTEMVVSVFEANKCFCFSKLRKQNYMYPNDLLKICTDKP